MKTKAFSTIATILLILCGGVVSHAESGEIPPTRAGMVSLRQTTLVTIRIEPPTSSVAAGDIFIVDVRVEAGTEGVDGVQVFLDFDPADLRVVDARGEETTRIIPDLRALGIVVENTADNETGQIDYAAIALSTPPAGDFDLASVRFEVITLTRTTTVSFSLTSPRQTKAVLGGAERSVSTVDGLVEIRAGPPARIDVSPTSQQLEVGQPAVLTAAVEDRCSYPVADGIPVTFTATAGSMSSPVTTTGGMAVSTLQGVTTSQKVTVTVTAGSISAWAMLNFVPGGAASLELTPASQQMGAGQAARLTATVVDTYTNPVEDGTEVVFWASQGVAESPVATLGGMAGTVVSGVTQSITIVVQARVARTAPPVTDTALVIFGSPHYELWLPLVLKSAFLLPPTPSFPTPSPLPSQGR